MNYENIMDKNIKKIWKMLNIKELVLEKNRHESLVNTLWEYCYGEFIV